MMELKKIREIIRLIQDTDVAEIEVWDNEDRVRIKRAGPGGHAEAVVVHPAVATVTTAHAPAAAAVAAPAAPERKLVTIPSPFVGTFYRSASPDRDPFVEVGSRVRKGQTLCIVEAMKLMNEIEAEVAGAIVELLVENGSAVEYGQALFRIDPA